MTASSSKQLPIPFGWYAVSFSADLKVGDVKPISYFGKELVIFRTESGEAKILDAYCPHLGAHLGHGGKVHGESIACPFHGWQFNGGGQCTAVPYAKNMPPKVAGDKQALYAYPTVERNQVIWAWYHPNRIAPTFEVELVPELNDANWTPVERLNWTINTSIQETAENAVDAAHFIYVHGTPDIPAGDSVFEGIRRTSKYVAKVPAIADDGSFDPAGGMKDLFLTTISYGPGVGIQYFTGAFNVVLMGLPVPITQNKMELHFAFTQPNNLTDGQKFLVMAAQAELKRQVEGDMPIWENKVYLESPTLCDGDGPIHQYRKWFRQFYAEPAAAPTDLRAVG
jgi:3-ketosteroid 9alpha-monooxygenase subunit A